MVSSRSARAAAWMGPLLLTAACGVKSSVENPRAASVPPPLSKEEQILYHKLESQLSEIIDRESQRHATLRYEYNEALLQIIDQIELVLSKKSQGVPPRFLPRLDAEEELSHFRETVRRWEAETSKSLRATIDPLKADVAARKPGEAFHPEFQRRFSQEFDQFIALEVAEMRERRNRAIHAATRTLLAPYREEHPQLVQRLEDILNTPPYDLPPTSSRSR
jgi:hypothetical protein